MSGLFSTNIPDMTDSRIGIPKSLSAVVRMVGDTALVWMTVCTDMGEMAAYSTFSPKLGLSRGVHMTSAVLERKRPQG